MTVEEQMKVSALLGIPLVDFARKAEDFVAKIHAVVVKETATPRLGLMMMAAAYLCYVRAAVDKDSDIFEEGIKGLALVSELFFVSLEEHHD